MNSCKINGINLSFVDRGAAEVLLMVHGFPLDHTMWNAQIETLLARHRVIAPDLRGFGQSSVTEGIVTMQQFADDLASLLDHLSIREPVVLCGLSMGGYVACEFWRKHAARLKALISATHAPPATRPKPPPDERPLHSALLAKARISWPMRCCPGFSLPPHCKISRARRVDAANDQTRRPARRRRSRPGYGPKDDFTQDLPQIICPALLIVGENDIVSPVAEMQAMAQAIPNAQFTVIPTPDTWPRLNSPTPLTRLSRIFCKPYPERIERHP